MTNHKPEFATNRGADRVADAINGHLAFLRTTQAHPPEMAIATAYFNTGGYGLLADELDGLAGVRILLGAEPQVPERGVRHLKDSPNPARASRALIRESLKGHVSTLEEDRDLLGFTIEADAAGRRLVDWLASGKVEVRRLEDAFLHGKAFIVTTHDEGVIAGSSNFTYAGLASNIELNLGHYQPHVVRQVSNWFEDLWAGAKPFDLASLYQARYEAHMPYEIYLRMLYERYGDEIRREATDEGAPRIHLTSFQRDGMWRAQRILAQRGGVLIADEVGLGKTFLAGELIRQAVEERRQRVLVIAPATLRDGPWAKFLERYMLAVQCVSFDQVADDRSLSPEGTDHYLRSAPHEYAMVVIDEAHNLRNPSTLRADALRKLLGGSPPKDLVMLTATPVNNSLWDLYSLLYYFIKNDASFADAGIRSLRDHFAGAMAMNPDDLSPEHLFDVLDAVAVRRTRPFVKRFYPNDTIMVDGRPQPITFPTPRVRRVSYDLEDVLPGFFDRFAHALDGPGPGGSAADPTVLTLARYAPSQYRLTGGVDAYEVQLAGLLRSGMLKRFESSSYAFACTCRKMAASHEAFLSLLDQGKVATGAALADWIATDSDELERVNAYVEEWEADLEHAHEFDLDALKADVTADRDLLLMFASEADKVVAEADPKLDALIEQLCNIAAEAQEQGVGDQQVRNMRKVLIFSYFTDTVDWIMDRLEKATVDDDHLAAYAGRLTATSGSHGGREEALWGFAPGTTDAPEGSDRDLYDIVVATDVLSEGVNLQQARHIINYDLPWNPMRLVQRHGRIDRIGSHHREVFLRCVFPDDKLEDLLGLEERLHRKIKQAAAAVGVGMEVLPGSRTGDVVFTETRDEIYRLRAEDSTLFETAGVAKAALSGEEYRQELRQAFENADLMDRVMGLPWASGSGMVRDGADPGYVFCARVADHPKVQFRSVSMADPAAPSVVEDTLASLAHARPPEGVETQRMLDEEMYSLAFTAWEVARNSIVGTWNKASDPANLAVAVPRVMNRAGEVMRTHTPAGMTREDADRFVDALQAPYPERVVKQFRRTLASSEDPMEQVNQIAQLVTELGLEPASPPEPLPEIEGDDVHLLCWLAIEPSSTDSARKRKPMREGEDPGRLASAY